MRTTSGRTVRAALLTGLVLSGCEELAEHKKIAEVKTDTKANALVCSGSGSRREIGEEELKPYRGTWYIVLDVEGRSLLRWSDDLGALVSTCRDYGTGCYAEIFPKKVEVRGAISAEEKIKIDLYRERGLLMVEERFYDGVDIFTADCRRGRLPLINTKKNMI